MGRIMDHMLIRRHARDWWFWVGVLRGRAVAVYVTDDFGNLLHIQKGILSGVIRA